MSQDWSARLRNDIADRAKTLADQHSIPVYSSSGGTHLFHPFDDGARHGNFMDESYSAILENPAWRRRLEKPHTHRQDLPGEHGKVACEVDSSNSSDALLMNCFCYPGAAPRILETLLPQATYSPPTFGVSGDVPLNDGRADMTEIDMRIGDVIFESKLTETDFTSAEPRVVERYRDFATIFEVSALPKFGTKYRGYQLIRNVLAAAAHRLSFVVLCDARRPDLLQDWWQVHSAIRESALRQRCGFLTWQQIAAASPAPLRSFLGDKYGLAGN